MPRALIALGANLGDRQQTLTRAVEALRAHPQITALAVSRWRETPPIGGAPGQGAFLNGAVSIETTLEPAALHRLLGQIENELGRQRNERWAARTIDLDLLLYDDLVLESPALAVPHPRMAFRRFVLASAAEVAPEMLHPTIGWSMRQLLDHLNGATNYVALLGLPGGGKTALAQAVVSSLGGRFLPDPCGGRASPDLPSPPSHSLGRQIQFLDARAGVLDRGRWPDTRALTVSDFYFDQSLAYAPLELDAGGLAAVRDVWQFLCERVVAPKLLVVLDEPSSRSTPAGLREEFGALAARRGLGPVLYAGGGNRQSQLDEICAAIAAMQ